MHNLVSLSSEFSFLDQIDPAFRSDSYFNS